MAEDFKRHVRYAAEALDMAKLTSSGPLAWSMRQLPGMVDATVAFHELTPAS